ncbi:MAG: O-antigen ligase family protein [Chloroflexota bacterium]
MAAALAAATLSLYPLPIWILGACVALGLAGSALWWRRWPRLHPLAETGLALVLLGTMLGFALAHNSDAAALRLAGIAAAVLILLWGTRWARTSAASTWTAIVIGACGFGVITVLALLKGQLPDSPIARALAPLLWVFGLSPGVSGDALDVNTRFAVHQYGLAHLVLVLAMYGIAALTLATSRRARSLGGLILLISLPLLAASQARGAMLALAVGATLLVSYRTRWALAIPPAALGVMWVLLTRGWINRGIETQWLGERVSYWTRSLGMLADFPLTGSGLGMRTFAEAFAWYNGLADPYAVPHTHNIFLQAYAEQGLAGAVGLGLLLIGGCGVGAGFVGRAQGPARWHIAGSLGAAIGSSVYGLVDQVPTTNLSLALTFATFCPLIGVPSPADGHTSQSWLTAAIPRDRATAVRAGVLSLLAVVAAAGLAGRWTSGVATNFAASQILSVALNRDQRGAQSRPTALTRATAALEFAESRNPANVIATRELGWAYLLANDIPRAHAAVERANRPDLSGYERAQLARLAREAGLADLAVDLLLDGGDAQRLRDVAAQLWASRRWREAAHAYGALMELEPENAENVSNTAYAVLNAGGSVQDALPLFREAVQRNPSAARRLAQQLVLEGEPCRRDEKQGGGRLERCLFWFDLASAVDPAYDRPEVEMGSVYFYRDRFDEAAARYAEALRRDSRNPSTNIQMADTLLRLGRSAEALDFFQRAVTARPERADTHAALARGYTAVGRRDDAITSMAEAVRLAPANAAYREELSRLQGRS